MIGNEFMNDYILRTSWSEVLDVKIDRWVTDEALELLEVQIPKDVFGKSLYYGVKRSGIGLYLARLSVEEATEQGFTQIMLPVQKSRPKELKGLKPDFKLGGMDVYVVDKVLYFRWISKNNPFWSRVAIEVNTVREFAVYLHKLFLNGAYLDGKYVHFSHLATTSVPYELAIKLRKTGHLDYIGYTNVCLKDI